MIRKINLILLVHVRRPIQTFVMNNLYWIVHIKNLTDTMEKRRLLKASVKNVKDISKIMMNFKWTSDLIMDWNPWVITIIDKELQDDCDGAAVLGKWLFEKIGMKSKIRYLFNDGGHAVCITDDHTIMITNHRTVKLNPNSWKWDVLNEFGGRYTIII